MVFIPNCNELTYEQTNLKTKIESYKQSNKGILVFFAVTGFFIGILIIHLRYNIISNERNLYVDKNGRLAATFKWNFTFKSFWHFSFSGFFSTKNLDLDYCKDIGCNNKFYLTRESIHQKILTFFHITPRYMLSSVNRTMELEDYKCKKTVFTNTPLDYVSPRKLVNYFVKFLPKDQIKNLNIFAKKINAEFSSDKKKAETLFFQETFDQQNEICGVCLRSVYLPKNIKTGFFEPSYSCVKLPCSHKFHVNCFVDFTFTKKSKRNLAASMVSIPCQISDYNAQLLVTNNNGLNAVDQKVPQEKSLNHLSQRELKEKANKNVFQDNVTTIPFSAKITKSNLKCNLFTISVDKFDCTSSPISVPATNKTLFNTNGQVFTDEIELEFNETIENTLNSRINRKVHCPSCNLDIELVLAYLKKMNYKAYNCSII